MTHPTAAERRYQSGFGNEYATEAVPGALPQGRNSPQRAPFDLYPELISGTAFTAPRHENRRSWLYRMRPTADHRPFTRYAGASLLAPGTVYLLRPDQHVCARWRHPTAALVRAARERALGREVAQ